MNNDMIIEVDFSDYAEIKASYTRDELLNIIRRIRADADQARKQLAWDRAKSKKKGII